MKTPHSTENQKKTDEAHKVAQSLIYPKLFNVPPENLKFESTSVGSSLINTILDGRMAIDRIVYVTVGNLRYPLQFTIQERFREPKFLNYQDLTITEWNNNSNLPSEIYKLNAHIFLYGYYDEENKKILDWIAVDVLALLMKIVKYRDTKIDIRDRNPRSNQSFIAFPFEKLHKSGCVIGRMNK